MPVLDEPTGRYKQWCTKARRWQWADNKRYCRKPGTRSSSAPPGNSLLQLADVSAPSSASAFQLMEITVPDIDWDAEERKSKMARRILEGPDANSSFTITVQQLNDFSATVGAELKRVDDEKQNLIERCMRAAEESDVYKRTLEEYGAQHAAHVRALEAERAALMAENANLRAIADRMQAESQSTFVATQSAIQKLVDEKKRAISDSRDMANECSSMQNAYLSMCAQHI